MSRRKNICFFLILVLFFLFASCSEAAVEICTRNGSQFYPAAAWNSTRREYLAVWYDQKDPGIYGVRLDPNGVLLDASSSNPSTIASINGNSPYAPSIACNPQKNQYLVVWNDQDNGTNSNIHAVLVSWNDYGNLIKTPISGIHRVKENPWAPKVAWNGEQFLIVWYDYHGYAPTGLADADIYGTRIDPNGTILDPNSFEICKYTSAQLNPVVTGYHRSLEGGAEERGWLVAWEDERNPSSAKDIYATLIKPNDNGTVLVANSFPVSSADKDQQHLSVTAGTDGFLVVWQDSRYKDTQDINGNAYGNLILGDRVSFDGLILGHEILITHLEPYEGSSSSTNVTSVAYIKNNYLAAWEYKNKVYGTRISQQGDILDIDIQKGIPAPKPLILSDPNKRAAFPFITADDSDGRALITWMAGEPSQEKDISGVVYSPPKPPVLEWAGITGYENDGVKPDEAEGGSKFTFKVKYTSDEGGDPLASYLLVDRNHNGIPEADEVVVMKKGDDNIYQGEVTLLYDGNQYDPGQVAINYKFYFRDKYNVAEGEPTKDHTLTIKPHNKVPRLSWPTEDAQEGVDPASGEDGSNFTFKVKYQDADGDAPQTQQVWIDLNGNQAFEENEKFDLDSYQGSNYKTGVTYKYDEFIRLNRVGLVAYRFDFNDQSNVAQGEPKEIHYLVITNTSEISVHSGPGPQMFPDLAATSSKSLVVWEDLRDAQFIDSDIYSGSKIYGRFLEPGAPLRAAKDRVEIQIGDDRQLNNTQMKPQVAGQGSIYLVVWEDLRNGAISNTYMNMDIYGQIVKAAEPDKLIEIPIATYTENDPNKINQENPAVAAGENNKFLVVWEDSFDYDQTGKNIHGAVVTYDPSTSTASVNQNPAKNNNYIIHDQGDKVDQTKPAVAWGRGHYLVVWQDYRPEADGDVNSHLYVNSVDPNGQVMAGAGSKDFAISNGFPICKDPNTSQSSPAIAADPNNFLVVCEYERKTNNLSGKDIYGILVRPDGISFGLPFPICTAGGDQTKPRVSWDQTSHSYLVVWASQSLYKDAMGNTVAGYDTDIRAARVSADGKLIGSVAGSSGWEICAIQGSQAAPAISSSEYLNQVVWMDNRSYPYALSYGFDIYGAPLKALLNWVGEEDTPYGVNPSIGGNGKSYTFKINYLDINDKTPKTHEVWIDINGDGEYSQEEKHSLDSADSDPEDGKTYVTSMDLSIPDDYRGSGLINYRFYFEDADSFSVMGSANLPHTFQINPPLLLWTTDYQNKGVFPPSGDPNTTFEFRVLYLYKSLDLSVADKGPNKLELWIDGGKYTMLDADSNDTNYADGKEYFYNFSGGEPGVHTYRFSFEHPDGGVAVGEPTKERQFTITTAESGSTPVLGWTTYTHEKYPDLVSDQITSLVVQGDTLWVGTTAGLSSFDRSTSKWATIDSSKLSSSYVTDLVFDSTANVLYVGTGQGLGSYDGSTWGKYDRQATDETLGKNPIMDLAFDKNNQVLWIAAAQSVYDASDPNAALIRYDISKNTWKAYNSENTSGGLPSNNIMALGVDSAGSVWVSTIVYIGSGENKKAEHKGLSRFDFDQNQWTQYTTTSHNNGTLKTNYIWKINGDDSDSLWVGGISTDQQDTGGTKGGLYRFDLKNNQWAEHFYKGQLGVKLGSNLITALTADDSSLWIGTTSTADSSGGVSYYDGNSWQLFTTADGLVNNNITAIAIQGKDIWFGTQRGLSRYGYGPGDANNTSAPFDANNAIYFPSSSGCFVNSLDNNSLVMTSWPGWIFLIISMISLLSFFFIGKEISMVKKVVAALVFFLLLIMPLTAGAESIRQGFSLELKGGVYCPSDSSKWNKAFGRDFSAFGGLKIGQEIFPNIELGLGADYVHAYKQEWDVFYVPIGLSLVYSLRYSQNQVFVPYLGGGLDFVYGKTGRMKSNNYDPTYLKEPAYHAVAGVRLLLDALAGEDAGSFDQKFGVNNTYLVFEAKYLELFDSGYADKKLPAGVAGTGYFDPKGVFISMGILFEF